MGKLNKTQCPKCGAVAIMTRHHIYPKRHYGKVGNNLIVRLCRPCHNAIELAIPYEQMEHAFYMRVARQFFGKYHIPLEGRYNHVASKPTNKPPTRRQERATLLRPCGKKRYYQGQGMANPRESPR